MGSMENWHYREGVTLQGKEAVEMHIASKVFSRAHLQNQSPNKTNSIFQTGTRRNSCPIEQNHLGGARNIRTTQ